MKFNNDNICNIVKDLLPLFADDACNESSKQLVEEHIKTCADCAQTLSLMKQPIETDKKPTAQAGAVKKATRRLRLRTIIIFILVITIAMPPAVSFINWYRGDGICFSNINNIKAGKELMEIWKSNGFEDAVYKMTPAYPYDTLCEEYNYFSKKPEDFALKEIQGRQYYVFKDIFEDEYVYGQPSYLQNFWYNIITETEWYYLIPADIYENLEKEYGEDFYKKRTSQLSNGVPKKITTEFGDYYFDYHSENNEYLNSQYYKTIDFRDKVDGVYDIDPLFCIAERADILTPELYAYYCKIYNDTVKWDKEYAQYYKALGSEGFTQQWRNDLLNYMANYKNFQLTRYKLTDIYQATDEEEWNMIFSVEFSNGACGNIYIFETRDGYSIGGAYPAERESEKAKDFFYGLGYTAFENYNSAIPSYKNL